MPSLGGDLVREPLVRGPLVTLSGSVGVLPRTEDEGGGEGFHLVSLILRGAEGVVSKVCYPFSLRRGTRLPL